MIDRASVGLERGVNLASAWPCVLIALALLAGCAGAEPSEAEQVESAEFRATTAQAVLTQHNDNGRTGATLAETSLNTTSVNDAGFGRLRGLRVRGSINAQPLFVPNLTIGGVSRNVVYVATMHNFVYAFAADGSSATPLWGPISLGAPLSLPDPEIGFTGYQDIAGEVGVVSTPVISRSLNALYVVATSFESGQYVHKLHKLSLTSGAALTSPVRVSASGFASKRQNQRPALLLANNTIYVAFASYGDRAPYSGWLFGYDATSLAFKASYTSTTSGSQQGGIWMAGQGPAADSSNNLYFITGNGQFSPAVNPLSTTDLGDSIIKLSSSTHRPLSWFAPANNAILNNNDGDLGSSGPLLIPSTNLLVGAGKDGRFYVLDRSNLGFFSASMDDRQSGVVQRFYSNPAHCPNTQLASAACHHIHGAPVFWNGPLGPRMYVWSENDFLKAFQFNTSTQRFDCFGAADPDCNAVSASTTTDPEGVPGGSFGMPGGFLSISANGSASGSGIVWATHPWTGNANNAVVEGVLRAYDASDLRRELWNSKRNPDRDDVGAFAKTVPPTVADGRVYTASYTGLARKVTLGEMSSLSPSLALGPSNRMYLGWTGTDTHLNLLSTTNGASFDTKVTLGDTSNLAPTLAGTSSLLYFAWVGTDGHLNAFRSTSSSLAGAIRMGETTGGTPAVPLLQTSNLPVGLTVGNNRVFIAWTGTDGRLNVMSALTGATSFDSSTKVTLGETSGAAPVLLYTTRLYLAWLGGDGRLNVAASSDNGLTFPTKQTLDEFAPDAPALASLGINIGAGPNDLHLFWGGTDARHSLNVKTADNENLIGFSYKLTFTDTSAVRPTAVVYSNRVFIGWRGDDSRLNVARYNNAAELGIYGKLN